MLDFSDCTRTGISILTSAADISERYAKRFLFDCTKGKDKEKELHFMGLSNVYASFICRHPKYLRDGVATPDGFNQSLEAIYARRLSIYREGCSRHLLSDRAKAFNIEYPVVYNSRYNFSYCMLSKTGTTSFCRQLLEFLPVTNNDLNPHIQLRGRYLKMEAIQYNNLHKMYTSQVQADFICSRELIQ